MARRKKNQHTVEEFKEAMEGIESCIMNVGSAVQHFADTFHEVHLSEKESLALKAAEHNLWMMFRVVQHSSMRRILQQQQLQDVEEGPR